MTANSLYRTVGGTAFPLSDTDETTAASLEPGRDILLALLAAALNDELAARWTDAAASSSLAGTTPVADTLADEPDPHILQTTEQSFPLLAVYWTGEGSWEELDLSQGQLTRTFAVDYILGPLTAGDRRKMLDFLAAALKVMLLVIDRGGHRAYATTPGHATQPKLVLGPGAGTANWSKCTVAPNSIRRGPAKFSDQETLYWAVSLDVLATEIESPTDGDPRSNDYEGVNASLGTGTVIADDPDESNALIDDLLEQNSYVWQEFEMLINVSASTPIDGRSLQVAVTGNTAAVTITLPLSPTHGQLVNVIDADGQALTYNITIDGNGKLINGAATFVMNANYESVTTVYNGVKWTLV
jgi:hypothetical protein